MHRREQQSRPKDFLTKLDRHTSSENLGKKFTHNSLQSMRTDRQNQQSSKEKIAVVREKSSSIRFRTTGAGFRQRVNKKSEETEQHPAPIFKRTEKQPRLSLPQ